MEVGQPSFYGEGAVGQSSPAPVSYLFVGLAALGLIAFGLLIVTCCSWIFSGYLENNEGGEGILEAGEGEGGNGKNGDVEKQSTTGFEENISVILAGQVKPTFLATPMSSKPSSVGT